MIKQSIKKILNLFSYEIKKIKKLNVLTFNSNQNEKFEEYFRICSQESLNVSKERFLSLYQSINYIYKNKIEGDFVECGVFKGGSAMMIAYAMKDFKKKALKIKKYGCMILLKEWLIQQNMMRTFLIKMQFQN